MAFLRDGEIARVEAGLALLADIDLPRVRQLLYGMDKRGLAALCARAGFGAPHYVALRMALDLAEQGVEGADPGADVLPPRRSPSSSSSTIRSGATGPRSRPGSRPDRAGAPGAPRQPAAGAPGLGARRRTVREPGSACDLGDRPLTARLPVLPMIHIPVENLTHYAITAP